MQRIVLMVAMVSIKGSELDTSAPSAKGDELSEGTVKRVRIVCPVCRCKNHLETSQCEFFLFCKDPKNYKRDKNRSPLACARDAFLELQAKKPSDW